MVFDSSGAKRRCAGPHPARRELPINHQESRPTRVNSSEPIEFDHAEHATTVMDRLECRFGETLRPAEPEPPTGHEAVVITRLGNIR